MDKKEIVFIIGNTPLFNSLKKREIAALADLGEVKEYKNGEIIYKEADAPDYFYLLLQGRVQALAQAGGETRELERLKRGTCFGIISVFTDDPHSVTTKSIETSFIFRVEKERFKSFLQRRPAISSNFFRVFSQRVKRRTQPKKIFQCKKIACLGGKASGKTTYMFDLGRELSAQVNRTAVVVEISGRGRFSLCPQSENKKVLNLSEFSEDDISGYIIKDKVDCLLVGAAAAANFSALINFLSENYHFVLYEIPHDFLGQDFDEFICPADFFHFLFADQKQELAAALSVVRRLVAKNPVNKDKIKLILSGFKEHRRLPLWGQRGSPIYATLPCRGEQDYAKALRRIARQVGEVVLGLALGSGGAYAFSHIGVLEVMEENGVAVDIICGSSMGGLVAALWAAGLGTRQMRQAVKAVGKRMSLFPFVGLSFPFKGFLRIKRLESIFHSIFGDRTFYDLKHPLKLVAFDFIRRQTKILEEGLVYRAVAASCAMPGIFEPVRFKKDILLDGGILNPLPTRVLLNHGAHKIIAVNVTPSQEEIIKTYKEGRNYHILDFIFGSIETMQRQFIEQAVSICDVVIHPRFDELGWMEFERAEQFIDRGRQAAQEKIEEIKKAVVS